MGGRYWVAAIAVGLMLALGGQTKPVPNQTETDASQTNAQEQWPPLPLPVQIVDEQAKKDARERAESEARQRDIDDVIAQQGMNDASQRMANAADLQTKIIFVGTVLVFVTLIVTALANKAAFAMVKTAEKTAERQLRAYVVARGPEREINDDEFDYTVDIVNTGQTPARRVLCAVNMVELESPHLRCGQEKKSKQYAGQSPLGRGR